METFNGVTRYNELEVLSSSCRHDKKKAALFRRDTEKAAQLGGRLRGVPMNRKVRHWLVKESLSSYGTRIHCRP